MSAWLQRLYNWWVVCLVLAIFSSAYLTGLLPWMNSWGISEAEAVTSLPGDEAVGGFVITSTRGVSIQAPAREVWKWVVQLGQERAGFYSNDWLENLVLADIHNANIIRAEWQQHQQGDLVLGAGGSVYGQNYFWPIRVYEEGKVIYLWGSIVVLPTDAHNSRLLVRTYAAPTTPVLHVVNAFTYDWMHFVMERGMLLGIKSRAEQTSEVSRLFQTFSTVGWILATAGTTAILFFRRGGWRWGLLPLLYATAILVFTADAWSAMAGFLWWGIIAAGFSMWARTWWKGLFLLTVAVVLVFILASNPHTAFGIIFLLIFLASAKFLPRFNKSFPKDKEN